MPSETDTKIRLLVKIKLFILVFRDQHFSIILLANLVHLYSLIFFYSIGQCGIIAAVLISDWGGIYGDSLSIIIIVTIDLHVVTDLFIVFVTHKWRFPSSCTASHSQLVCYPISVENTLDFILYCVLDSAETHKCQNGGTVQVHGLVCQCAYIQLLRLHQKSSQSRWTPKLPAN